MKSTEAQKIKNMGVKPKLLAKQIWARLTDRDLRYVLAIAKEEGKYQGTVVRDLLIDGLKYRGLK